MTIESAPPLFPPVELGGGITVTALTDAIADHRRPLEACFPGEPAAGWPTVKERYPETVSADGHWRLPINLFLVQTPALTVLVDAGVGCERTIAARRLPGRRHPSGAARALRRGPG